MARPTEMAPPRIVLITGAPGSGKTTLGRALAEALRVPFLARDDVRGGLLCTAGAWTDTLDRIPSSEEAADVFLTTVELLAARGVSCVVEYVVRTERPGDFDRLAACGQVLTLVTECPDALERFATRHAGELLIAQPAVLRATGHHSVEAHTADAIERMTQVTHAMRTDFPVPTLHVDTSDDDDPKIDAIVAFVTQPPR